MEQPVPERVQELRDEACTLASRASMGNKHASYMSAAKAEVGVVSAELERLGMTILALISDEHSATVVARWDRVPGCDNLSDGQLSRLEKLAARVPDLEAAICHAESHLLRVAAQLKRIRKASGCQV